MIIVGKGENKFLIFVFTLAIISLLGFIDYSTNQELGFSIFYLIPISIFALYKETKATFIIICCLFAASLWFLAEFSNREYSSTFFPVWNAFVRLIIFSSIGLLLLKLKNTNKELNNVITKLKVIDDEKNKFMGMASHDLRNPIGGIYSLSSLVLENYNENLDSDVVEILNLIKTTSNSSLAMLENLLDVSKIESGKIELNLKSQDYLLFVKQQISFNQILAKNKNIIIVLKCEFASIMVLFDDHYLNGVLDNLLSNAIKYSFNDSEIIVTISLIGNNQLLTEVRDNGKGIPEEEQKKLFNYFQTTSTRPTAGEKSTGLGLAIAKRIIKMHNGEIGLKSNSNNGSNFFYTLPIK
jgi:signal transduction histidine kinase